MKGSALRVCKRIFWSAMWVTDSRQGGKGELFDTWPRCGETRCTVGEWVIEGVCGEILWESGCELRVGGWWEGLGENCMAFTRVGDSGGMWECQSTSLMGESWLLWPTTSESQNLSNWIGKHCSFCIAIWTYSLLFIDNGWLLIFMQRFVLIIYHQIDTVQKKELDSCFSGDQGCYKNIFHPWFGSLFRHTQWGPVAHSHFVETHRELWSMSKE